MAGANQLGLHTAPQMQLFDWSSVQNGFVPACKVTSEPILSGDPAEIRFEPAPDSGLDGVDILLRADVTEAAKIEGRRERLKKFAARRLGGSSTYAALLVDGSKLVLAQLLPDGAVLCKLQRAAAPAQPESSTAPMGAAEKRPSEASASEDGRPDKAARQESPATQHSQPVAHQSLQPLHAPPAAPPAAPQAAPQAPVPMAQAPHLQPLVHQPPPPPPPPPPQPPPTALVARRPDVGSLGAVVKLQTNFTKLSLLRPGMPWYMYDVSFWKEEAHARQEEVVVDEAFLPTAAKHATYCEFELPGGQRYATDYSKLLLTAVRHPAEVTGPHVVYVPSTRVWVRVDLPNVKTIRIDDGSLQARQCIDIVMRNDTARVHRSVGQTLFDPFGGHLGKLHRDLSKCTQMWEGVKRTVQQTTNGLCYVIDLGVDTVRTATSVMAHAAQYMRVSIDGLGALLQNERDLRKAEAELKKCQATRHYGKEAVWNEEYQKLKRHHQQHPGMTAARARQELGMEPNKKPISQPKKPIKGLGKPPREYTFSDENGETNVAEFFAKTYGVTLRHPELPCVLFGAGGRIAVPMELCELAEGQAQKNPTPEEKSQLVSMTSEPPAKRKQTCDNLLGPVVREVRSQGSTAAGFGIGIEAAAMDVDGRQLSRMPVLFGGGQQARPDKVGSWNLFQGSQEFRFVTPAEIRRAVAVDFCPGGGVPKGGGTPFAKVFDKIREVSDMRGLRFGSFVETVHHFDSRRYSSVDAFLEDVLHGLGQQDLVFAVLPEKPQRDGRNGPPPDVYQLFKGWCASRGVASQCLLHSKLQSESGVPRKLQGYVNNVLLKVNIKLGGISWVAGRDHSYPAPGNCGLSLLRATPTLVIGLDVHHPAPGIDAPSFIGMLAFFVNPQGGQQYNKVLTEKHAGLESKPGARRPEIVSITQLARLMTEAIRFFRNVIGTHPRRVLFYRDGVADSQFLAVHTHEVEGVKRALAEQGVLATTPLVFVVAQKRNAARFFNLGPDGKVRPEYARERNAEQFGAPRPGTVVDTGIVSAEFDFYLQGAHALKGTPHPVHYHVLLNEAQLGSDEVQRFTFELCHAFGRCTKSVSLPSVLMWADIAAEKAPFLAEGYREQTGATLETMSMSSGASGGGAGAAGGSAAVMRDVPEHHKKTLWIA